MLYRSKRSIGYNSSFTVKLLQYDFYNKKLKVSLINAKSTVCIN